MVSFPLTSSCNTGFRWMTEKMDGVRGHWNGEKFISRQGKLISCPEWFSSTLPTFITLDGKRLISRKGKAIPCPELLASILPTDVTLDGELWMGQGSSNVNLMKVLNSTKDSDWSQIGYYVYDISSSPGTYEERMEQMEAIKSVLPPHVHIVENIQCRGTEHLLSYLDSIVAQKGEGIMLRKAQTKNETGYTSTLLKVKVRSNIQPLKQHVRLYLGQKFEDTEVEMLGVVDDGLLCRQ